MEAETAEMFAEYYHSNIQILADIFVCFICMGQVKNAHLCPKCSKICCYSCIKRWLTEHRSQCPYCQASLRLNELVNCRWSRDCIKQLHKLGNIKISKCDCYNNDTNLDLCESNCSESDCCESTSYESESNSHEGNNIIVFACIGVIFLVFYLYWYIFEFSITGLSGICK